jgi:hypothetical protein
MPLNSVLWKLASPYDAYVSHVARLNNAIDRIRDLSGLVLAYEAGLQGSVRYIPGGSDAATRVARFREQLGSAAARMSDEEFEQFLEVLGGGDVADVERDRAQAVSRLTTTTRGIDDYFAIAGHELAVLEKRGFSPGRPDIARQLRDNGLPPYDLPEYRQLLHELGGRVGKKPV